MFRPHLPVKGLEIDVRPPADNIPSLADMAKFSGSGAGVAIGIGEAGTTNFAGGIGEHHITRRHFPEKIVKAVTRAILFAFGRPNVTTFKLVSKGLVVIDPPVTHEPDQVVDRRGSCQKLFCIHFILMRLRSGRMVAISAGRAEKTGASKGGIGRVHSLTKIVAGFADELCVQRNGDPDDV